MSTRIISAAVAIVIAIIALILHNTFIFNLFIAFITVTAVYEIFRATGMSVHKKQAVACYAFAAVDCIMPAFHVHGMLYFISYRLYMGIFVLAMCILYLKEHKNYKYNEFFFMLGVPILLSYSFGTLINMAQMGGKGVFLIVLTLAGAWLSDSGAYFAGTFLGKTPLCPEISPKKTVEGVVGGIVCNGVFMLIISFVYDVILKGASVRYVIVFIAGMACAIIGLVGDLTASMIKRQTGIKDYGNIMPGHGGVMDRFDSVILVAPFMYYLISQGLILK
ncbi:MAG: phosphatidate cytidylyltransferase [Ruminococcus sp.]|nr:phosphatidate cytidylyltransferase [Ruminococcus sp.]